MTPEYLPQLVAAVETDSRQSSFLVVSRTEPPPPLEQYFPENSQVEWLCHVCTADDIVAVDKADLGIVFDQIEHMDRADAVHLLARLRDQYCKRTVVLRCVIAIPVVLRTRLPALASRFSVHPCECAHGRCRSPRG